MATNPMVNFKKGLLANLPATKTAGTFYVTTDERAMYLDVDASTRIRLGDFQEFATVDALKANANPNTSALYYISGINCLAKWNGSEYIQINKDTGMTSIEVTGNGNAITAAAYDAAGRKLTLTKGATYMTAADVDGKISDKVGELKIGEDTYATVKAYVDKKTSGIATDASLSALADRVTSAEADIDALQAATAPGGAVTEAIADAKKAGTDAKTAADKAQAAADKAQAAADKAQGEVDALETKVGTVPDKKTVVGLISEAKAAADAAQADVDALEAKVGNVPNGNNVVKMIGDVDTAYKAKDAELAASIKAISDDYLTSADKTELQGNINKKVDQTTYDRKVSALETADTTLQGNIDAEKTAREDADKKQVTRIANLESQITGLSGAMHFEGVKDSVPANGTGYEAGDVIIVGEKEYVFNGTAFVEFGDVSAEGDRIRALENTVGKAGEGDTPATGLIKDIADNAAAITAEANRAKAAEKANSDAASAAKTAADNAQAGVNSIKADYLKKADKTALEGSISAVSGRVTTLEGASHTHANKTLLDSYTQTEADLADAVAKKHSHANATVLNGITANKVSAWDSAEANAKSYADEKVAGEKTRADAAEKANAKAIADEATTARAAEKANADAIKALQNGKANKATTLSGYGITDAYTKTETYTQAQVDALLTWGSF